jgi:signal transduction histidine kinase
MSESTGHIALPKTALPAQRSVALEAEIERRMQAEAIQDRLVSVAATVHRAETLDEVFQAALEAVCSVLGVERAAVLLFDDDGVMRFKAARGISAAYQRAVEGHTPWTRAQRDAAPIFVRDVMSDPDLAPYRAVFQAEGIAALGFVPLAGHEQLLGKFMVYSDSPREFSAREAELASIVATQVALAVARTQLLEAERRARREAEQLAAHAQRLFDSEQRAHATAQATLAIVSHDLRTPLGAVLLGAGNLLALDPERPEFAAGARRNAETIKRSAERMARLIEDLVDFASMQAGRFTIEKAAVGVDSLLHATLEQFTAIAKERGLRLRLELDTNLPLLQCDHGRMVQALSNLVANAVKVTAQGGRISVGAHAAQDAVLLFVDDTGHGLGAEELPRLFDRYWRGARASYRGCGLGLTIAKGIVDAHGGRIWAESTLGVGSRFTISLPLR